MKKYKQLETRIKEVITDTTGSCKLKTPVIIKSKEYAGFNYDTQQHEEITKERVIDEVERYGKKGVAYVSDGFNM